MGVVEVSDPGSLQSDSERQLGGNDCQGVLATLCPL